MNAITKAISEVYFNIPNEILNIIFTNDSPPHITLNNVITVDELIMRRVIRPRVLVDANLVGGSMVNIPLTHCKVEVIMDGEYIITVPKSVTDNKTVISALSLSSTMGYGSLNNSGNMMTNMMNSVSPIGLQTETELEVVGENVILARGSILNIHTGTLRCILSNSENLTNISPKSYIPFSELCVLAVKSYIYNNALVKLNKGYVFNGNELTIIKEVIDTYSDSEEAYKEYLKTKWTKIAFMNDTPRYNRFIKARFPTVY